MENIDDPKRWTENVIQTFIETSIENRLADGTEEKAWTDFLLGFAAGTDPIFKESSPCDLKKNRCLKK